MTCAVCPDMEKESNMRIARRTNEMMWVRSP